MLKTLFEESKSMLQLRQPDIKAVINFVTVATLLTVLASVIFVCFQHYSGFPTYTDISMVNQPSTLFPAMTFCPDTYPRAKEEVLKVSNSRVPVGIHRR